MSDKKEKQESKKVMLTLDDRTHALIQEQADKEMRPLSNMICFLLTQHILAGKEVN